MIEVLVQLDEQARLSGVTAAEQEAIGGLARAQTYRAKLTAVKPRSWRQLKFYWATLDQAVANQEFYLAATPLHLWLKHRCGLYDKMTFHDGTLHLELHSAGLEKMDPAAFNEYFDKALYLLCTEVCPGMERKDLLREVERATGIAYLSLRNGAP